MHENKNSLTTINSINFARILAQIVYYFYFYFQVTDRDEEVCFVVPTGNFGDILAGFYAKKMGLPLKLVIATNENDILDRFMKTGEYSIKHVISTNSPAMDIQISSNFERCIYHLFDVQTVINCMNNLKLHQKFSLDTTKFREFYSSSRCSNEQTISTIQKYLSKGIVEKSLLKE